MDEALLTRGDALAGLHGIRQITPQIRVVHREGDGLASHSFDGEVDDRVGNVLQRCPGGVCRLRGDIVRKGIHAGDDGIDGGLGGLVAPFAGGVCGKGLERHGDDDVDGHDVCRRIGSLMAD